MLYGGNRFQPTRIIPLQTLYISNAHFTSQKWILAEAFRRTPPPRVARNIQCGREKRKAELLGEYPFSSITLRCLARASSDMAVLIRLTNSTSHVAPKPIGFGKAVALPPSPHR